MSYKNPFLMTDFYKLCHMLQYPEGLTSMTSYMVPRFSRLRDEFGIDRVTFFGLVGYIKEFVVDAFNKEFFGRPFNEVAEDVGEVLHKGLGYDSDLVSKTLAKIRKLHEKRFLPVCISGLPEGTDVPMGCPCVEVLSTDSELPWVGQVLEASMSAALWHPMLSATVARRYRVIAEKAYAATVDKGDPMKAMCDFSMRGQESVQSAVASSAAWLTAMCNSSTVAARSYIGSNYIDGASVPVYGLTSTEHSVMCTHAALGKEEDAFDHLFKLYENASFAAVCDSYNFWNVLTNILPKYKDTIAERGRRGYFIGVRHDSADPVAALCGIPEVSSLEFESEIQGSVGKEGQSYYIKDKNSVATWNESSLRWNVAWRPRTWEEKGMVETMGELFGTYVNTKGYKVLNPGVKAVYGDSITVTRAEAIYERLAKKGFAASNVSLGVGSFSFQCMEDKWGGLHPFTRDTFSIAMKCTHATSPDADGVQKPVKVYKDPVGFSEKKSLKGLCRVHMDGEGRVVSWEDGLEESSDTMPVLYFINGSPELMKFSAIRNRVTASVKATLKQDAMLDKGREYFEVIRDHMRAWADETKAANFVVGLSGGKDSTVVAMLLTKLFGPERVYGVMLPVQRTPRAVRKPDDDLSVAWKVADLCRLSCRTPRHVYEIPIESSLTSISTWVQRGFCDGKCETDLLDMNINLPARIRMSCLFAVGQAVNGRVINTSNLSEDTVGYATQFGDNAGCYAPLQDLTVTEVRQLGMWLAVNCFHTSVEEAERLIYRVPADGLQPRTDEDRLGFSYDSLDRLIREGEGDEGFKKKIMGLYAANKFKTDIVRMPKPEFPNLRNYVKEMYKASRVTPVSE